MLGADRAYTRDPLLPSAGAWALQPQQVREVGPGVEDGVGLDVGLAVLGHPVVVVHTGEADRRHARSPGAGNVGAAQVADVDRLGPLVPAS